MREGEEVREGGREGEEVREGGGREGEEVREGGGKGGGRKVRGEGRRELTVNLMVVCRPSTCSNCTNSGIVCTSDKDDASPHTHVHPHTSSPRCRMTC